MDQAISTWVMPKQFSNYFVIVIKNEIKQTCIRLGSLDPYQEKVNLEDFRFQLFKNGWAVF